MKRGVRNLGVRDGRTYDQRKTAPRGAVGERRELETVLELTFETGKTTSITWKQSQSGVPSDTSRVTNRWLAHDAARRLAGSVTTVPRKRWGHGNEIETGNTRRKLCFATCAGGD